jgi:hypothetical protein
VSGIDVSPGNLALADQVASHAGAAFQAHLLEEPRDIRSVPEADWLISLITFQHNPPPLQRFLLRELLGRLRQEAVFVAQFYVWDWEYTWSFDSWHATTLATPNAMDMHCLPTHVILQELTLTGFAVCDIIVDNSTDGLGRSSVIVAARS